MLGVPSPLLHKNNHHSSLPTPYYINSPSLCATPRVLWTSRHAHDLARNHRSHHLIAPATCVITVILVIVNTLYMGKKHSRDGACITYQRRPRGARRKSPAGEERGQLITQEHMNTHLTRILMHCSRAEQVSGSESTNEATYIATHTRARASTQARMRVRAEESSGSLGQTFACAST